MGGFLGTVLLGVLADPEECLDVATAPQWCVNPGTVTRSGEQLGKQLLAACITAAYSFTVTFVLVKIISLVTPIVPSAEHLANLDLSMHGEQQHTPPKVYEIPTKSAEVDSSTLRQTGVV